MLSRLSQDLVSQCVITEMLLTDALVRRKGVWFSISSPNSPLHISTPWWKWSISMTAALQDFPREDLLDRPRPLLDCEGDLEAGERVGEATCEKVQAFRWQTPFRRNWLHTLDEGWVWYSRVRDRSTLWRRNLAKSGSDKGGILIPSKNSDQLFTCCVLLHASWRLSCCSKEGRPNRRLYAWMRS